MTKNLWLGGVMALFVVGRPAFACAAEVTVLDRSGRPLAEAVVELSAPALQAIAPAKLPPGEAVVDQRHETFLPLVTIVRKGGHVIFTNNDTTMHQVYSFSPIRQFAFEIDEGQRSPPVEFDKPGIVAIGCNIHDRMITYVYVTDSPRAAKSDRTGVAAFTDLAPGNYRGTVWHPQLAPGSPPDAFSFAVAAGDAKTTVTLPINAALASTRKSAHMQMY